MSDPGRGLLDTSVVIAGTAVHVALLPSQSAISSLTLMELAVGPHATQDPLERALRQERLQQAEAAYEPLPFDASAARAFVRIYVAVRGIGRDPRGRTVDLQIAAIALANSLPLYTRNPDDFRGLDDLVTVVAV